MGTFMEKESAYELIEMAISTIGRSSDARNQSNISEEQREADKNRLRAIKKELARIEYQDLNFVDIKAEIDAIEAPYKAVINKRLKTEGLL